MGDLLLCEHAGLGILFVSYWPWGLREECEEGKGWREGPIGDRTEKSSV